MASIFVSREPIQFPEKYHNHHLAVTAKFLGFSQKQTSVELMYAGSLTEQEVLAIQTADANYVDNDPYYYVLTQIFRPARAFGQTLIDEFAAENILLGISSIPGMTNSVRKTMKEVTDALTTGSLKDAIYEARQIQAESKDPVFISDTRLLKFVNKIEEYLGLPASAAL